MGWDAMSESLIFHDVCTPLLPAAAEGGWAGGCVDVTFP